MGKKMNDERCLLVVSGPSGCGKDTVVQNLIGRHPEIEVSVSATSRAPRGSEVEGVDYHYVTKEEFENYIKQDMLLEYTEYVGNYYGTLKSEVDNRISKGIDCVLVIEVNGAAQVKKAYPNCTTVFIMAPSMEELERRLKKRGTETMESMMKRLHRAEQEMEEAGAYHYQLVNDDPAECAKKLYEILQERKQEE